VTGSLEKRFGVSQPSVRRRCPRIAAPSLKMRILLARPVPTRRSVSSNSESGRMISSETGSSRRGISGSSISAANPMCWSASGLRSPNRTDRKARSVKSAGVIPPTLNSRVESCGASSSSSSRRNILDRAVVVVTCTPETLTYFERPDQVKRPFAPRFHRSPRAASRACATESSFTRAETLITAPRSSLARFGHGQEGNPIVQVASLFNQLLHHFPRTEFAILVKKHAAERAAKGFTCWTQLVSMLFCQLGRADSLREICNGLGCCLGRLVHVGILRAPCRSTLSYANEHRPAALFEDLFFTALARFRDQQGLGTRQHKFRFKNKLLSLDSTTISLCLTLFPWAKFRRAKGGVKAHVLLDHDDYLPAYVLLTEAKRSDVKLADSFRLNPGSI